MMDKTNSVSGILLKFSLSGPGVHPQPAALSVHLHNTQQKVQLQGGAKMLDKTTSAIWFLQHILKERFIDNAKRKKFDISRINNLVASVSPSSQLPPTSVLPDECPHCLKRFTGKSRPIKCTKCTKLKHTTRCGPCPINIHQTTGTTPDSRISVITVPTTSSPSSSSVTASPSGSYHPIPQETSQPQQDPVKNNQS